MVSSDAMPTARHRFRGGLLLALCGGAAAKPSVAVFPLAGSAPAAQREQVGLALRARIDHDGHHRAIDGPAMDELSAGRHPMVAAAPAELVALAAARSPALLVWGEMDGDLNGAAGATLRLRLLDTTDPAAAPRSVDRPVKKAADLRAALDAVLAAVTAPPVATTRPTTAPVPSSPDGLWQSNPNLLPDGDFARSGQWSALLRGDKYLLSLRDYPPDTDQAVLLRQPDGRGGLRSRLVLNLSRSTAESNGLSVLSGPAPVRPGGHYRLSLRYRSDGPSLHLFVKGYRPGKDLAGQPADVECYRLELPPAGPTGAQYRTVTVDLTPHAVAGDGPVTLRVDVYAYLAGGSVGVTEAVLKDVERPAPTSRPTRATTTRQP